tara:strand:+ start:1078 stop:2868 length:1791 start_codon:yes stop_codon:yes gene_type:complete
LFPSVLRAFPDFCTAFATPLVRVTFTNKQGKHEDSINFFTEASFNAWREARVGNSSYVARYYKGLGALSNHLAKVLFQKMDESLITLSYTGEETDSAMQLYFHKDFASDRREKLKSFNPDTEFDYKVPAAPIPDWCDTELCAFSTYNNSRVFPCVIDGLKPGQRKVLDTVFKTNQTSDIKVFQLTGAVAKMSAYHHGDASLNGTIVGMASEWNNNVCLLWPEGQYGSANSHKAASPRYLSTRLEPLTLALFPKADNAVLTRNYDDGKEIEPRNYCPLIPLLLVNGANGIGVGWTSSCPMYKPEDVVHYVRSYMQALGAEPDPSALPPPSSLSDMPTLTPWYRGFSGTIEKLADSDNYITRGVYERHGSKITITELPIGSKQTIDVVEDLKAKILGDKGWATSVENKSGSFSTRIEIQGDQRIDAVDIAASLKLESKLDMTQMHFFDESGMLKKYTVAMVVQEHAAARLKLYRQRLDHQIGETEVAHQIALNKRLYIQMVRNKEVDVVACEDIEQLEVLLVEREFERVNDSFKYLTSMALSTLTVKEASRLKDEEAKLKGKLADLKATTPMELWKEELDELDEAIRSYNARARENRP